MTGLECRWDRIKPPSEEKEIVCYLVEALQPKKQIEVYRAVLMKIDAIYVISKTEILLALKG